MPYQTNNKPNRRVPTNLTLYAKPIMIVTTMMITAKRLCKLTIWLVKKIFALFTNKKNEKPEIKSFKYMTVLLKMYAVKTNRQTCRISFAIFFKFM